MESEIGLKSDTEGKKGKKMTNKIQTTQLVKLINMHIHMVLPQKKR